MRHHLYRNTTPLAYLVPALLGYSVAPRDRTGMPVLPGPIGEVVSSATRKLARYNTQLPFQQAGGNVGWMLVPVDLSAAAAAEGGCERRRAREQIMRRQMRDRPDGRGRRRR